MSKQAVEAYGHPHTSEGIHKKGNNQSDPAKAYKKNTKASQVKQKHAYDNTHDLRLRWAQGPGSFRHSYYLILIR